jgi:hypothetical protein
MMNSVARSDGSAYGSYESPAAAPMPAMDMKAESEQYLLDMSGEIAYGVAVEGYQQQDRDEKILKKGSVSLESENFEEDLERIKGVAAEFGGYVESARVEQSGLRWFYGVIRVPRASFENAKEALENTGSLVRSSASSQNVTSEYYDTQGRLEIKKVEQERTNMMREKAKTIEDILYLEQRLGEITADIEVMEARLANIDSLSSYSSIEVNLEEVQKVGIRVLDGDSLGLRIKKSFLNSVSATGRFFQGAAIGFATVSIQLAIIVLIVAFGIVFFKKYKRKEAQV